MSCAYTRWPQNETLYAFIHLRTAYFYENMSNSFMVKILKNLLNWLEFLAADTGHTIF